MHSLPVSQLTHAAPALPQEAVAVPALQVVPLKQPVQQAPPMHFPPLQPVLSATLGVVHLPAEQALV